MEQGCPSNPKDRAEFIQGTILKVTSVDVARIDAVVSRLLQALDCKVTSPVMYNQISRTFYVYLSVA